MNISKIRRLGIFCFFDEEGIVDSYIEYLLHDLNKCLTKLIIVVNGYVSTSGKMILEKYSKNVIIRENKGFDIAAFKEGILSEGSYDNITKWDEIVFCNDTFYGPFIPFSNIFDVMRQKKCDFWGLNFVENGMFSHLQSYFLTFRTHETIGSLLEYLNNEDNSKFFLTNDIKDIYAVYELGLFRFLVQKGFTYASYTNTQQYSIYEYPDICIEKYHLPILKKRCFTKKFYKKDRVQLALYYINKLGGYDILDIEHSARRKYGLQDINRDVVCLNADKVSISEPHWVQSVDEQIVSEFILHNRAIYIYGTGVYACKVWFLFHELFQNFCGFIVSDNCEIKEKTKYGKPVLHYSDINRQSAIVVGCDENNTRDIIHTIGRTENICIIWKNL